MNRQDTLKATSDNKIADLFIQYLRGNDEQNDFQKLSAEVNRLLDLSVSKHIIFYNLTVTLSMVKIVNNYDVIANQNKIDKTLTLLFPDETYRKDLLGQLIVMTIMQKNKRNGANNSHEILQDVEQIIDTLKKYFP